MLSMPVLAGAATFCLMKQQIYYLLNDASRCIAVSIIEEIFQVYPFLKCFRFFSILFVSVFTV